MTGLTLGQRYPALAAAVAVALTGQALADDWTTLDFDTDGQGNAIVSGQVIDNEYANLGINITAELRSDRLALPTAVWSGNMLNPGLHTPSDYGAVGNDSPLDNVLIVPINPTMLPDGTVKYPKSVGQKSTYGDHWGGIFTFTFDKLQGAARIGLLDIDGYEPDGYVKLYRQGALVDEITIPMLGQNTHQTLQTWGQFDTMEIGLAGSGAVSAIEARPVVPTPAVLPAGLILMGAISFRRRRANAL